MLEMDWRARGVICLNPRLGNTYNVHPTARSGGCFGVTLERNDLANRTNKIVVISAYATVNDVCNNVHSLQTR